MLGRKKRFNAANKTQNASTPQNQNCIKSAESQERATMIATLQSKTGRDLDSWIEIVASAPCPGFMDRVRWLKAEHGLGHFQARLVVEEDRDR